MTAIVVAEFKIADPERYAHYTKYSGPAVAAAGGRSIARCPDGLLGRLEERRSGSGRRV
jgi:uncharacterized protein (DUF1330 family)